jgi:hypothetical protein
MRGFVALLVLVLGLARVAGADADPTVAKRLFAEGRVLYDQGKFIEACVLFEKSYQLDPAVGTKLNLAECAERDGKPRAAWLLWISAADEFEQSSDQRERFARDRADALAPKLATVVVRVAKPKQKGLVVQIAGREVVPAATIVDRLDPGAIVVSASAPGRRPFETTITVALGGKLEVEVPALEKIGGPDKEDEEPPAGGRNHWWTGAVSTGVVAALATGAAVASFIKLRSTQDELDTLIANGTGNPQQVQQLNEEGAGWATRTNIAIGAAVVTSIVTVVLVVKARSVDRRRQAQTTAWRMTPVLAPRTAGAQLELRW